MEKAKAIVDKILYALGFTWFAFITYLMLFYKA